LPPPLVERRSIRSVDQITVPATRIVPNSFGIAVP
jgi:hypothetical protein